MYYLSVCAIVQNELPYLPEWLEFHRLQGVEHFYLYCNSKDDGCLEYLKTVPDVTATYWGWHPGQFLAYNNCILERKKETEWCAFLDCDEFLYSIGWPLSMRLSALDLEKKSVDAVVAHWLLFGSNGEKEYDNRLVIDRFTRRASTPDQHVKSICRLRNTIRTGKNPHYFEVSGLTVDEYGKVLTNFRGLEPGGSADILRINHYHVKSKGEYTFRKSNNPDPGSGFIHSAAFIEEKFAAHDRNEVEDTYVRDAFSEKIKEKLCR